MPGLRKGLCRYLRNEGLARSMSSRKSSGRGAGRTVKGKGYLERSH